MFAPVVANYLFDSFGELTKLINSLPIMNDKRSLLAQIRVALQIYQLKLMNNDRISCSLTLTLSTLVLCA